MNRAVPSRGHASRIAAIVAGICGVVVCTPMVSWGGRPSDLAVGLGYAAFLAWLGTGLVLNSRPSMSRGFTAATIVVLTCLACLAAGWVMWPGWMLSHLSFVVGTTLTVMGCCLAAFILLAAMGWRDWGRRRRAGLS